MKKGLTELVFILDRSGSMCGLEDDTIGGFNGMIRKQKEAEGEAFVTTVLFDDRYEVIHDRVPLKQMKPLTTKEYYVRGCTALLDALGRTITKVRNTGYRLPEEERPEKVIVVITTDGFENASEKFSYAQIRHMTEDMQKHYNWEFIFLGANMDAVAEGARFGIRKDRSVTFANDGEGIRKNYQVLGETLKCMRAPGMRVDGSWKKEIEEETKKRSRSGRKRN